MDAAAKLERILGPGWEAFSVRQVERRAEQLERESRFAWQFARAMGNRQAPSAGSVLQPTLTNRDHE